MLEDLQDFMEDNHDKCVGIIGSGNYNFADLYIFTAKDFSKKYNIPIIYDFENRGNKKDIEKFKEIIEGMIEWHLQKLKQLKVVHQNIFY